MGPRGLLASYLYWYLSWPAGRADQLAAPWQAAQESRLHACRGPQRKRVAAAGPDHELVFTDRVIATLVVLSATARRAGGVLRRGPLNHDPGRPGDPAAAGGPRLRVARPPGP